MKKHYTYSVYDVAGDWHDSSDDCQTRAEAYEAAYEYVLGDNNGNKSVEVVEHRVLSPRIKRSSGVYEG